MADEIIITNNPTPVEPAQTSPLAQELLPAQESLPVPETESSSGLIEMAPVADSIATPTQEVPPETLDASQVEPAKESFNPSLASTEMVVEVEPKKAEFSPITFTRDFAIKLLIKAREAIQFRRRKKLDRLMTLFLKKSEITNDDVEKLLHVSDSTATRYLSILEKEGKIKKNGKGSRTVTYSRS